MTVLEASSLNKTFKIRKVSIKAVDNLDLSIEKTDFFALVGESGSGKSTVAKLLLRLINPESGKIFFKNKNLLDADKEDLKNFRQSVGVVFQDPYSSLNPRMKIFNIVEEPLKIFKKHPKNHTELRVSNMLEKLGIDVSMFYRYPHQLSGGQRQRVAIARALILDPDILIADEPLSALDISLQATIINQLIEVKKNRDMGILLITHDLNIVRAVSNKLAVMHLGRIVEEGNTKVIFKEPLHPYTKVLLDSIPGFHRRMRKKIPKNLTEYSFSWHPVGCRFYDRCEKRMEACKKNTPELKTVKDRKVRCFLY